MSNTKMSSDQNVHCKNVKKTRILKTWKMTFRKIFTLCPLDISSFRHLKLCSWVFCAFNHLRWMIELPPSRTAPTIRNVTNLAVTSRHVNSSEIIDHIYDIIEKLQKICFNMNLFFGKKVGEARIEIGKVFFSKKLFAGDFYDLDGVYLPHRAALLPHQQHSSRLSQPKRGVARRFQLQLNLHAHSGTARDFHQRSPRERHLVGTD